MQMLIRKRNGATYFCSFLQVIPRSLLEAVHSSQLRFYSFYLKQKIFLCFWKQDWSVNFEPLFTNNHFKVQMNAILILSFRPPAFQCQYMGLKLPSISFVASDSTWIETTALKDYCRAKYFVSLRSIMSILKFFKHAFLISSFIFIELCIVKVWLCK